MSQPNSLRERAAPVIAAVVCLAGIAYYVSVTDELYPTEEWLFSSLVRIWLYGLLLNAAYVGAGHVLLTRVLKISELPSLTHLALSATSGMVVVCVSMYVLGALGLWVGWAGLLMALAWSGLGLPGLVRGLLAKHRAETEGRDAASAPMRILAWLVTAWGVFSVAMLYLGALTPESINYDAGWYHLPIAEDYAREGKLVPFYGDHNKSFPHLKSVLDTWAFIMPGLVPPLRWMLALQNEFTIVLWTIVSVQAAAQWMLGDRHVRALWVAFFLFPCIFVYDHNIGGSSDLYLGVFALPMFLALGRFVEDFDYRYAALLGVVAAGAVLTKFQAVYMVFACTVVILARAGQMIWRDRSPETIKRAIKAPLMVAGVGLLAASPHFIKNAAFHGNPLYPFFQDLFPTSHPIHEKSAFFFKHAYPNRPFLPKGTRVEKITNAAQLFFTYSFEPHYSFTKHYPSGGSVFTLLLPCALFLKDGKRLWLGIAVSFLAMMVWGNTYIGDRYLHGLLPMIIATGAALVVRVWELGLIARIGLVPLLAFQLVWGADTMFYSGHDRMKASIDLVRSGYEGQREERKRFPYRLIQRDLREVIPEDARVLSVNFRGILGIDREILSDVQAWQSLFFYEPIRSPRELWELYRSQGVTHILRKPGRRPAETLQGMILIGDLEQRFVKKQKKVKTMRVSEMPDEAPPAMEGPYLVTVLGSKEYKDGLYPVEELHTYKRVPKEMRHKGKALERFKGKGKERAQKLRDAAERSHAVAVANGKKKKKKKAPDSAIKSILSRDFQVAARNKRYTVYVRKPGRAPRPAETRP